MNNYDLQALLQPIAKDDLCGKSLRHDTIFTDIRIAREEDDPGLPMGQWERPLKVADWDYISSICCDALINKSKDLQLAMWLTEAWMRKDGLSGFCRGLSLIYNLTHIFWDQIHPIIEDNDADARVAPFEWLNESLSLSLSIHVYLFNVHDRQPSKISLSVWETLTSEEIIAQDPVAKSSKQENIDSEKERIYRAELLMLTRNPVNSKQLLDQLDTTKECIRIMKDLKHFLDSYLKMDSPNLNKLMITLSNFERVLQVMTVDPNQVTKNNSNSHASSSDLRLNPTFTENGFETPGELQPGFWRTREEAYSTLEAVANYLQVREPHSPTPYLIKKAVRWGRLSLPDLMQEIMREEGDLNRMSNLFSSD
jgi:type VI secretion system protein ImpA